MIARIKSWMYDQMWKLIKFITECISEELQ
jgi:hypothetical protein